jgi:4-carboxymuconolactone decarboxylase
MSRLRLLERDEAPLLAREWYRHDGTASPLTRSLANAPDAMETLMPFMAQMYGEGAVDLATKELVIVRVSHLNRCRYCLAAHRPAALDAGVSAAHLAAVCEEKPLERLPEREHAIMEWTDRFVLDPLAIDDTLTARVLDHVRDDQLVELALVAGLTQMLNHYCAAFDVAPP